MISKPYRELPIGGKGKVALVDADLCPQLARFNWIDHPTGIYRWNNHSGKRHRVVLSHVVMNISAPGVRIRYRNRNLFDCRRENLRVLSICNVSFEPGGSRRNPWRVRVNIDGEVYNVGVWPTEGMAEDIRKIAAEIAVNLRGKGLPRERVQRLLDLARGHGGVPPKGAQELLASLVELSGEELMEFATSLLPMNLPAEIREEARQAIVLDLLTKKVSADALKDARLIRRYVSAAYGFQNSYRFRSLDAPVNDGETTLGELIAA
jgi:hypothetical protein